MLFWKWIYISTALTEFIDSAKKLKRPWNEMPLSHLRKVIPSQNPEAGPASVGNGLCITSNPGVDIKLLYCPVFLSFLEKNLLPTLLNNTPFVILGPSFLALSFLERTGHRKTSIHFLVCLETSFPPRTDTQVGEGSSWVVFLQDPHPHPQI